jgi:hypothetical protein
MKIRIIPLLIFTCLFYTDSFGINKQDIKISHAYFIQNKGQWTENILYYTKLNSLDVWFTTNGIYYDFYKIKNIQNQKLLKQGHVIKFNAYSRSISLSDIKGVNKLNSYQNYFIGNTEKWATNVELYHEIVLKNVYDGIDQRWYFNESSYLRYDYIIHPNIDYKKIQLSFDGIDKKSIYINKNELIYETRFGEVKNTELLVYQIIENRKIVIPAKWVKNKDSFSIELQGDYNPNYDLIIDPLVWSTFLGGNDFEDIRDLHITNSGDILVTGSTLSFNFPTTTGTYDNTYENYHDAFISKLSANGSTLIFSTFLGGNKDDYGVGIVTDNNGKIYVCGDTESTNFPFSINAYDQTINGSLSSDVFITKFNSSGNLLEYSTYFGGAFNDHAIGIKVDNNFNMYVAGSTESGDFPVTLSSFDNNHNGNDDIFISKFNSTGSSLVFSTFLGGNNNDVCRSFALDNFNNVYLTGYTTSINFPKTTGVFSTSQDLADVFVSKISNNGSSLLLSTVIGGNDNDIGLSIVVDAGNRVAVAGKTSSSNFPVSANAYLTSHQGYSDGFIFQLNSNFTTLEYSTYIGGLFSDEINSITKTSSNEFIVIGNTQSDNFPITMNAHQKNKKGVLDLFITKFSPDLTSVTYSSYFGGSNTEYANKIYYNQTENAVIFCGRTYSPDFPVTTGAYDISYQTGEFDGFISKLYLCPIITFTPSSNSPVCIGDSVKLNCGISASGYTYNWYKGTFPIFSSTQCNPSFVSSILSSGYYSITATNTSNGCKYVDSVLVTVQLKPDTIVTVNNNTLTANQNGASYQWLDCDNGFAPIAGATGQSYTTSINGNYAVKITLGACIDTSNCYNISTISMNEIFYNKAFKIYPNPAREALTIEVSENSKLEVYAYDGKLVAQENIANRTVLNVRNFNNGIYFVRLTNEAGETYQTKFVKN